MLLLLLLHSICVENCHKVEADMDWIISHTFCSLGAIPFLDPNLAAEVCLAMFMYMSVSYKKLQITCQKSTCRYAATFLIFVRYDDTKVPYRNFAGNLEIPSLTHAPVHRTP